MTAASNVQKLPSSAGLCDHVFAESFGPNGSCVTWPAVQNHSENDSGSRLGWILIKLATEGTHTLYIWVLMITAIMTTMRFLSRKDFCAFDCGFVANLKLQRRFKTDPQAATQKLVEAVWGSFLCGQTASLQFIYLHHSVTLHYNYKWFKKTSSKTKYKHKCSGSSFFPLIAVKPSENNKENLFIRHLTTPEY